MKRRWSRTAALSCTLGVGLVSGCAPRDPADAPPLDDVVITLPGFDSLTLTLVDGAGERQSDDGSVLVRVGLTDWIGVDDLDADGDLDAAAVIYSSGGGSGTFMELALFGLARRGWTWTGSVALGDRVRVRVLAVDDGLVVLHLTEHGPDDPACCPTVQTERRFRATADGWAEVADGKGA